MQELFANNAESTIDNAGGITSTGTSITLPSGEGARFPAAVTGTSQFRAVLVDPTTSAILEYVTVTNRSTDTLTVTRESEDATRFPKAARAQGVKVVAIFSATALGLVAVPAGAGGPGKALLSGTADYAQAWTAPNWGGGDYFRSGYYSNGLFTTANLSGQAVGAGGGAIVRPFLVPVRRAFDRLGVYVTTAATAGGTAFLALYGAGSAPGALITYGSSFATTTTGAKEVVISATLDPGVYWLAVIGSNSSCNISHYSDNIVTPWYSPSSTPVSTIFQTGGRYYSGGLSAGVPATNLTGDLGPNPMPAITLRAA